MRLNLKDLQKNTEKSHAVLEITDRLPPQFAKPCTVEVDYQVRKIQDYYLIDLHTTADVTIHCMRCAEEVKLPYENETTIAVCNSDTRAETLLKDYECIVTRDHIVDLTDIITDELHLYSPQFHPDKSNCNLVFD